MQATHEWHAALPDKTPETSVKQSMSIDYVIPFVDCSDGKWLQEYKKYVSDTRDWSNNATRFRDWDTLRYQLRSIERYMPWIRNIFIVMSVSETQVPEWLNTQHERVHIVWDWEIVPYEYLPVFNSNVIDLYIPRIDGLSEHYLYTCDDYIILRSLKPEDFFTENGIRLKVGLYKFKDWTYSRTIINSNHLICPEYITKAEGYYLMPYCDHAIVPHLKPGNLKVMEKYHEEIEVSLSRFRDSKNLTWLIYPLSLMKDGLLQNGNIKTRFCALRDENSIRNLNFKDCDVIVLNDEYQDNFFTGKPLLINRLEELLPDKSVFEK